MKICLLDYTKFEYSYVDKDSPLLRGAETIFINLYEELLSQGHEVIVFNNCSKFINDDNTSWYNIESSKNFDIDFDVAIANGNMNLFDYIKSFKKHVISYSLQSLEKFFRKRQLLPYLKYKPSILVIGKYHKSKRSKLISMFGSNILPLAIDEKFNNTKLSNEIDNNLAIFTSRADRNMDLLIEIWNSKIQIKNSKLKLLVTPPLINTSNPNIVARSLRSKDLLIKDLLKSRLFLVPGHKAELYCLAAEEARELCLPIVTLGIGSLSERVVHGKTGFIAKNHDEFANYTLNLFEDNDLWTNIRNHLFNLRGSKHWNKSVLELINIIKS